MENYKLGVYREILDRISTGVMIVSYGAKLVFANSAAEDLLRSGNNLKVRNGQLEVPIQPILAGSEPRWTWLARIMDSEIGNFGKRHPIAIPRRCETAICYVGCPLESQITAFPRGLACQQCLSVPADPISHPLAGDIVSLVRTDFA